MEMLLCREEVPVFIQIVNDKPSSIEDQRIHLANEKSLDASVGGGC
jgi:hypothetical protein